VKSEDGTHDIFLIFIVPFVAVKEDKMMSFS